MIFALLLGWVSTAAAFSVVAPPRPYETLIVDTRVPVLIADDWVMMSREEHQHFLQRRRAAAESGADGATTTTTTIPVEITTGVPASAISSRSTTSRASVTAALSALPSPFDNAIASNFSSNGNCQEFITGTLANTTFKQCYPFSMLVQGSTSMFNAEKSLVSITQVLDATCNANVTFCTSYLDDLADQLTDSANCATEYADENSMVVQVYQGLRAYQPLYSGSCLKDADTSAYCFAGAITNSSAIGNSYLYYLPLNISYPNTTTPQCDSCTRDIMGIFQAATADRTAAIANTYAEAAEVVNAHCGAGYVNATLPAAVITSWAVPSSPAPSLLLFSLLVAALSNWLL